MTRSALLQRQTNLLGALEAVIGEPVPRSVAKTGPVLSVIASAFRREQGIGVMRERRRTGNTPTMVVNGARTGVEAVLPEGAMVFVPDSFDPTGNCDEDCAALTSRSSAALNTGAHGSHGSLCVASCKRARAYLRAMRGSK